MGLIVWLFRVLRLVVVMGIYSRRQNIGSGLVPSGSSLPQRYDRLFGAGLVNGIPAIGRHGSRAPDPVRSGALCWRFEENIHLSTMSPVARSGGYPISRISFEMSWLNLPIVCYEISWYDTRNQNLMFVILYRSWEAALHKCKLRRLLQRLNPAKKKTCPTFD